MDAKKRWFDLLGFFLLFGVFYLTLALATFSPLDQPASSTEVISNWAGEVGAHLAYYLQIGFGHAAWLFLPILFVCSVQLIRQQVSQLNGWAAAGWFLLILSLAGSLALTGGMAGGLLGRYVVHNFVPLFGQAGTLLFFAFLFVVGASLQTASSIRTTLTAAWEFILKSFQALGWVWVSGWGIFKKGGEFGSEVTGKLTDLLLPDWRPGQGGDSEAEVAADPEPSRLSSGTETAPGAALEKPEEDGGDATDQSSETDEADEPTPVAEKSTSEPSSSEAEAKPEAANGSNPVEVSGERPEVAAADMSTYEFPPLDLLDPGDVEEAVPDEATQQEVAEKLEATFEEFGFEAEVVGADPGPVLTMYEVEPGPGVSVNKFQSRADDIKLSLAVQSVRIVSPIPGKSAVGIEVPNPRRALVKLYDVFETDEFQAAELDLPLGFGLDVFGEPLVVDLGDLPHLLIAGATGSGKSVCINSLICSLLFQLPPDELKFILIDPKRVELKLYDDLPHLITEVIDDPDDANQALQWAVEEMERRYEALSEAGCRNLNSYNETVDEADKLPYLVIIVDELADLMLSNKKECEQSITRIAQKARAVGIHLVLATQRPSTDVITGLIKANMSARISFRVSSGTDSRVVIDQNGAETLLGNGDLLYLSASSPQPRRAQGSFLSDEETKSIIRHVKQQLRPSYIDDEELFGSDTIGELDEDFDDEYYEDAKELVVRSGKASASMIQRKFRVGYNRAARMVDMMEEEGIVGPHRGSKARRVLVEPDEYFDDEKSGDGG